MFIAVSVELHRVRPRFHPRGIAADRRGPAGMRARAGRVRTERPPLRHQPPNRPDSPTRSRSLRRRTARTPGGLVGRRAEPDATLSGLAPPDQARDRPYRTMKGPRQPSRASAPAGGITSLTGTPHATRIDRSTSSEPTRSTATGPGRSPRIAARAPPVRPPLALTPSARR